MTGRCCARCVDQVSNIFTEVASTTKIVAFGKACRRDPHPNGQSIRRVRRVLRYTHRYSIEERACSIRVGMERLTLFRLVNPPDTLVLELSNIFTEVTLIDEIIALFVSSKKRLPSEWPL
jgi:hypothetical protein